MRRVFGQINRDGVLNPEVSSQGIRRVTRSETGKYRVDFDRATFSGPPSVVATLLSLEQRCGRDGTSRLISVTDVDTSSVCFGVIRSADPKVNDDRDFNFVATGR